AAGPGPGRLPELAAAQLALLCRRLLATGADCRRHRPGLHEPAGLHDRQGGHGGYWLLVLIAGVTALACMSQLAFMIALVRQEIRDPLTGILSRGSGTEILHLLWSNAEQNNSCLALAFFDIDHFKSINDTYGHEAGDRVLQEFTGNLQ